MQVRSHIAAGEEGEHGQNRGERGHYDGFQTALSGFQNGMFERDPLTAQGVDRVDFENRIVDDDTADDDKADHRHQVERYPEEPQDDQRTEKVDDNLREDDPRLDERFELCGEDEEEQQQRDDQYADELSDHVAVGEITAAETYFETIVVGYATPDRRHDSGDIFGRGCQVERVVISFCACDDLFEIRVHGLTHQNADRNFGLGRTDEGLAEQIVEVTQVVADHHGKRLVSGRDCEERVFVQCIAQRGDEVGVGNTVKRHLLGARHIKNILLQSDRGNRLVG